ncbi:RDD family protein [Streptomyces pinistramenti]|uniref:RDD family protein n=1 Tax=Streptomyces pinistramenti TaxID=2884812 RepID=UPI001D09168D|nr:RDD family protein [Streptomyces pinistramenti]MCB5911874.1 RDD family protein [Streptomyces pinistramenti]
MSAPTSGSAGSPTPGFYPDPSIPGYIRYWNGAAWVPGTSRPAPADGEAMPAPPPGAAPALVPPAASVEETGPVFFDEEEAAAGQYVPPARQADDAGAPAAWDDPARLHGSGPEPASAWQADASRQGGFGSEAAARVSWGSPDQPGTPQGGGAWGGLPPQRDQRSGGAEPGAGEPPAAPAPRQPEEPKEPDTPRPDGTVTIRAVQPPTRDQGTTAIRAIRPDGGGAPKGNETMAIRLPRDQAPSGPPGTAGPVAPQPLPLGGAQQQPPQAPRTPQAPPASHPGAVPGQGRPPQAGPGAGAGPQGPVAPAPSPGFPGQGGPPSAPPASGPGADEGVIPWKPPTADIFFAAAQAAQGHPAALGRRLGARLIDLAVLLLVTAAAALPLWGSAVDHIDGKIEAAKQSGRQVTVYLLDGTTFPVFAVALGVLLIGGGLIEVLPTLKWGRTLGKKLCGVRVLDIESHDTPPVAAAVKRWLVYGVLGVLVVGVANAAWCLFDRPWRQCWHDKVARTFVAAD